jgi:hypothetical protein
MPLAATIKRTQTRKHGCCHVLPYKHAAPVIFHQPLFMSHSRLFHNHLPSNMSCVHGGPAEWLKLQASPFLQTPLEKKLDKEGKVKENQEGSINV